MDKDKQWYKMVKIPYMKNSWGKKRERAQRREMRENGAGSPLLFFSHRPGHVGAQVVMLEHGKVPDPSFRCCRSTLELGVLCLSMPLYSSMALKFQNSGFFPLLISIAPQAKS